MTGRLIGVVGPSGVGKDSVMEALVETSADFGLVRRVITRAPGLGGENYEPVSETEFEERQANGDFCVHWQAHGLSYGIPDSVRLRVGKGEQLFVNLSRAVLLEVASVFPRFTVLSITASPETLVKRLKARGRENADDIARRLKRATASIPAELDIITVSNDGALEDAVEAALAALHPASV